MSGSDTTHIANAIASRIREALIQNGLHNLMGEFVLSRRIGDRDYNFTASPMYNGADLVPYDCQVRWALVPERVVPTVSDRIRESAERVRERNAQASPKPTREPVVKDIDIRQRRIILEGDDE